MTQEQYKKVRNETTALVRQIKNNNWEAFSKRMEKDFYGLQKQIWRMIRTQRKEINDLVENKHIAKETWMKYLRSLYSKNKEENVTGRNISEIVTNNETQIVPANVQRALRLLKNRKSPGQDSIPNELLKHDSNVSSNN